MLNTTGIKRVICFSVNLGPLALQVQYEPETRTATAEPAFPALVSPEGTPGEAIDWFLARLIGIED